MDEMKDIAREALANPWVQALLIVVGSVVLAKIVDWVLTRAIVRVTRRTKTEIDEKLVAHLHRPIFFSVMLVGLWFALNRVVSEPMVLGLVRSLMQTVATVYWTRALLAITTTVAGGMGRLAERAHWLDERTIPLFDNLAKIALILGGAVYAFVARLGSGRQVPGWPRRAYVGIASAFAAKDSLANLFGGLFVIMDAPYKIGDFINLDTGERGRVIKIGLRSTRHAHARRCGDHDSQCADRHLRRSSTRREARRRS